MPRFLKEGEESKGVVIVNAPYRLTIEITEKICDWIRKGNLRSTAAILAGITNQTMLNWMASGEQNPDSPCGEFRQAVLQAEKDNEAKLVAQWEKINANTNDFRSIQNFLERRHRGAWEPPATKTELTGAGGGPITIGRADLERLTPEELETHIRLMEKMAQGRIESAPLQIEGDTE